METVMSSVDKKIKVTFVYGKERRPTISVGGGPKFKELEVVLELPVEAITCGFICYKGTWFSINPASFTDQSVNFHETTPPYVIEY
jgi:hypothetical protein